MYNSAAEEAGCWGGRGRPHVTLLTSCDSHQQRDGAENKKISEESIH